MSLIQSTAIPENRVRLVGLGSKEQQDQVGQD